MSQSRGRSDLTYGAARWYHSLLMTRRAFLERSGLAVAGLALSCSKPKPEPPKHDQVEPLLQKEAESLQKEGEQVNPSLGVETRWNLEAVEIREQAGNEAQPWAGTIKFKIVSKTRDGSSTVTERFEKSFDYVFDAAQNRWLLR